MAQEARFWDRIAQRYAKKPVANEEAYQKKLAVTREYFRPDTKVLEFGCGTGSTAIAHAPFVGHIRATDISPAMIEIAKGKAAAASIDNVTFEPVAIEDLEAADESFDVVLGMSILHLLESRDDAIAKVYNLLAPGGAFITSTVYLGDSMRWFRYVGPIGRFLRLMPLVKVFTEAELVDSLTGAGFEVDYHWRPDNRVVFIVAKKPARNA